MALSCVCYSLASMNDLSPHLYQLTNSFSHTRVEDSLSSGTTYALTIWFLGLYYRESAINSGLYEPQNVESFQYDTFSGSYAPGKASLPPAMKK